MRKVCTKMVPKNLTTEQKANRRDVCLDLLERLERSQNSSVALSQVMNHEFGVRPREKTPKSGVAHCKLSPTQESVNKQIQNQIDVICFFGSQGIVQKEFVPPGQTVNQSVYREVLERLRKRVARVRPGTARTWMLHHDNAPCHTAVSINEFLAEKTFLWFLSPPIRRFSVPVTSLYSPGSKTI